MTPAPEPSADPGLTGLVGVARELYGADSACLVLVDAAGGQRTLVASGRAEDGAADAELVARVVAQADVVAAVGRPELPGRSWAGAPLLDLSGRVVGVLAISTSRPDPLPQDRLSGLRVVAEAALARLDQLAPAPVPAVVRPVRAPERSTAPGAALVDRDRLLRTADSALAELRSCGEGSAAALVLTVKPGRSPLPSDDHGADLVCRLRAQLRPGDLLARLADDAYAVLLPALPAGARYVALGVADRLAHSLTDSGGRHGGASTGLAFCHAGAADAGVDARTLLARAERAALVATRRGPSHFHVHRDAAPVDTRDDAQVERLLRTALDDRSLVVHYQPVVGLASRGVVGVEALVRLRGSDGALVPPDRFIAIAERVGLIGALGDQVRRTAMHAVAGWRRDLPPGRVLGLGVNLSVRELDDPGLVDSVREALASSGLAPDALKLEITESAFMDEGRGHESVLAELRALGARLYIDDFGTGFSSLSYLRRFPVDGLKIDRTFVGDLLSGPQPAAVTAAIVHLAQELGVDVVAEGVETEQQAQVLTGHGCRLAQGYLFSRPQPAEAVQPLLLPAPRTTLDAAAPPVPSSALPPVSPPVLQPVVLTD